jgi:hypothetical protein
MVMLELFLKLIDRFIDLAKRREEVNRKFYIEFIAPAFADFEAVHKNYMDTFLHYREMILDNCLTLNEKHPVIDLISRDSLFSDNLRAKVSDLFRLDSDKSIFDSSIQVFLLALRCYMEGAVANPLYGKRIELPTCQIRYTFRKGLTQIFKRSASQEDKRKRAINVLDNVVADTQEAYAIVLYAHSDLKNKLLKPR